MATWVIGDVHGCFGVLMRLLEAVEWTAGRDRLVFVGDLVNRGPDSVGTLRWLSGQGPGVEAVLGNHDLHLLARAVGVSKPREGDTLDEILEARDREDLLDWLRCRRFLLRECDHVVVHAGLSPLWTLEGAMRLARGLEARLAADGWRDEVRRLFRMRRIPWDDGLGEEEALAASLSVFTRIRMVRGDGRAAFKFWDAPEAAPAKLDPWYARSPVAADHHLVFGHWAMLGIRQMERATCLDGGCVYGGRLAALRLEDHALVTVDAC